MTKFGFLIQEKGDWSVEDVSVSTQNTLICIEMFPISIAYFWAFGYKSFKTATYSFSRGTVNANIELQNNTITETGTSNNNNNENSEASPTLGSSTTNAKGTRARRVLTNFVDVANVKDVVDDTLIAVRKGPQRKVFVAFMALDDDDKAKHGTMPPFPLPPSSPPSFSPPFSMFFCVVIKQGWLFKRGEDLAKVV